MSKIVLIACSKAKFHQKAKAQDMYEGILFKKSLKYAKSINADFIFILSAKYGLLRLDEEIEPYDKTLNKMPINEKKLWADSVLNQLKRVSNLDNDKFLFFAGDNYRKFLIPHIVNYEIPMERLGIGKQLKWLTENNKMSKNCQKLHNWFKSLKRHSFPFNKEEIPENGIYILFEKGEFGHSGDRIVRIGTHTGKNQLRYRLQQHFEKENKDRSIFRKNIGRALLKKDEDPFLEQWNIDLTTKKAKELHADSIDTLKLKETEKRVSNYITNNFSFVVFEVNNKTERLELESKLISTVSLCNDCKPSANWLGLDSPKEKIRKSGLWLVNELWKTPLSDEDMQKIIDLMK
ncbi:DUF6884 domain-containing protein [Methanobacterium sp.]|uniref:DUF6884 domain-containing protein n=1 Tax=Methanobacterium sp. TaxID=2164 RepID=UPI002ABB177C|nr:DUF6884 domain-containing protein [Methanobacterium sp.]MDY9924378.1 hypothetical protein [Methanobacterium sp.]